MGWLVVGLQLITPTPSEASGAWPTSPVDWFRAGIPQVMVATLTLLVAGGTLLVAILTQLRWERARLHVTIGEVTLSQYLEQTEAIEVRVVNGGRRPILLKDVRITLGRRRIGERAEFEEPGRHPSSDDLSKPIDVGDQSVQYFRAEQVRSHVRRLGFRDAFVTVEPTTGKKITKDIGGIVRRLLET